MQKFYRISPNHLQILSLLSQIHFLRRFFMNRSINVTVIESEIASMEDGLKFYTVVLR